jgi:ribosomal subunit interface protein
MKLPLQITFRDMLPLPSVEPEIRRRADKLDQWTLDVMSCHVVVDAEANRHRQGHAYRVQVSVRVPGEEIAAGAHHLDEDIHRAVGGAFDAADRQLEDYVRRRRGQVKLHRRAMDERTAHEAVDEPPAES